MNSKTSGVRQTIIDIVFILLIIILGIALRFPINDVTRSQALTNELTDEDCLYLSDPDSYLYARKAREYSIDLSNFTFVNTRQDDYMMNPVSDTENGLVTNGLPLVAALVYRFLHLFTDISIEQIIYYINVFICSLAAIPAYLYVKKQTNIIGGIVSGVLAVCAIPFLEHSIAGYFDTDAMLCTLPLALMTCFAMMVYSNKKVSKIIYAILSLLFFAILASTWETFYIYYGILVFLSIVSIAIYAILFRKNSPVKGSLGDISSRGHILREILHAAITLGLMLIIAFAIYGTTIIDSIRRLITNMLVTNDYPDPTKYIVELSDIPFLNNGIDGAILAMGSGIVNNLGGVVILVVALASVVLIIIKGKIISNKFLVCNFGFIAVWLLITFPLLIVGVRFLQLVCLPLVLLIGLGVGVFSDMIIENSNKLIGYVVSAVLSALIIAGPVVGAFSRGNNSSPFYTKTYDRACTWVNDYAIEDASILTWWDYGYFIQYKSARHVLADGGTFDGEYFYWLGHALLTDNPRLSAAIFNMLDSSGVTSADIAKEYIGDTSLACNALLTILPMEKEEGISFLVTKYNLTKEQATNLVNTAKPSLHDEQYLFISRDLISKINALCYYGFYDFEGSNYDAALGVSLEPIVPSSYDKIVDLYGIKDCSIKYRETGGVPEIILIGDDGKQVGISKCIYVENGIKVREESKNRTGYTIYCIKDNGECSFIVCSDFIADSMLVSLMATNSNESYERVYASVEDDRLSNYKSITAKFFGNAATQSSAGVLVYKVRE